MAVGNKARQKPKNKPKPSEWDENRVNRNKKGQITKWK